MIKRVFDIVISAALLALLLPLILALAIVVRIAIGSPVLFRQQRPGLGGEPFELIKFRSMSNDRSSSGELLSDDERMTGVGRFLRATSLDELPELWNVLNGDMSLVGPRPLLMRYLPYYTSEQARRHEVRPGLTGWAQVNGRNAIPWDERFSLDLWYVDNRSMVLDLWILVLTLFRVIGARGIRQENYSTVEYFDDYVNRMKKDGRQHP